MDSVFGEERAEKADYPDYRMAGTVEQDAVDSVFGEERAEKADYPDYPW